MDHSTETVPAQKLTYQQKITLIFQSMFRSVTDLNYYVDILNTPFRFSLKVMIVFYILLGFVLTLIWSMSILPQWKSTAQSALSELYQKYPDDLVFSWDSTHLTTQPDQEVIIDFPEVIPRQELTVQHLANINTTSESEPENQSSAIYINSTTFYLNSFRSGWSSTPLNSIFSENFTFSRSTLNQERENFQGFINFAFSFLPFVIFLGTSIGLLSTHMLMLVIDTVILHFAFGLMGKPLNYRKVYQLCLHLLIPVELINQVSVQIFKNLDIPMFTVSFWVLSGLLLWHLRNLRVFALSFDEKGEKKEQ